MTLYIATDKGNVPMSEEEEAKIKAEWEANSAKPVIEKPKSMEERVTALEIALGIK